MSNYVFKYIESTNEQYNIIFADPPYSMKNIDKLVEAVLTRNLLKENGWFILEHQPKLSFENHARFIHQRKYGSSVFSIFGNLVDG